MLMQHTLIRRNSKPRISFADNESEYGDLSNYGDGPEWLSLSDHQLSPDGLQARRTVGEALLQAKPELRTGWYARTFDAFWRSSPPGAHMDRRSPGGGPIVFSWTEVLSISLVPTEGKTPTPSYLISVSTLGSRDTIMRETLLQAADARDRALFGLAMGLTIVRARVAKHAQVGCGVSSRGGLSIALATDIARVACEAACCRPSASSIQQLADLLRLLTEDSSTSMQCCAGGFPVVALQRFGDVA